MFGNRGQPTDRSVYKVRGYRDDLMRGVPVVEEVVDAIGVLAQTGKGDDVDGEISVEFAALLLGESVGPALLFGFVRA